MLRAASFLASIPADVGAVRATASGSEGATDQRDGPPVSEVGVAASAVRRPEAYAYGGAPVVAGGATADDPPPTASADGASDDEPQGYGEYGYGGVVS